jgi:hypothetical protein
MIYAKKPKPFPGHNYESDPEECHQGHPLGPPSSSSALAFGAGAELELGGPRGWHLEQPAYGERGWVVEPSVPFLTIQHRQQLRRFRRIRLAFERGFEVDPGVFSVAQLQLGPAEQP